MALICAAKSCKSHKIENDQRNLVFFPFPEDEETCRMWVLRSGRHDLLSKTVGEIHVTEFLCECHFEEIYLDRNGPVVLKPKAKPTLFDHDMSRFAHEIVQEKVDGESVQPDVVVIPCVIMDGVNTEVISFDGESIKEDNINRDDIERELQLIHEGDFVTNTVLPDNEERLVVHQVINELQPSVENETILDPNTLVVDSIHAVESSEWQENSVSNLTNQLCRICGSENVDLISVFDEQGLQLQIIDKIQWHLPIVIKEDDKLPLKVCSSCVSLLNSWHDLVTTCVETDTKLRKLFQLDEEFDPSSSVYCDLNPSTPDRTLDQNVSTMEEVLSTSTLVTQRNVEAVIPLDEISLQTTDDSMGMEMSKVSRVAGTLQLLNDTKEIERKSDLHAVANNIRNRSHDDDDDDDDGDDDDDAGTNNKFGDNEIPSNNSTKIICQIEEIPYDDSRDSETKKESEDEGDKIDFVLEESLVGYQVTNVSECEGGIKVELTADSEEYVEEREEMENELAHEQVEESGEEDADDPSEKSDSEGSSWKPKEPDGRQKVAKKILCELCGFSTRNNSKLLEHIVEKHSASMAQLTCEYCDKIFPNEVSKNMHERTHIKPTEKAMSSPSFVCEFCGKAFRSRKTLKEHHIAMHSDDKPYKCDKCDKNYGSLLSLDIHKATHSSETPCLCDLCGKTFKHVSNLRSHKRSHLDESRKNKQICLKCGKGFRSRFHLSEHMNVHEGKRPYACDVCGKRFYKKIQLRQHGSSHSGTQPFKCPICSVKFNRRGNMTQHMKRHGQERKFTCRVCGAGFPTLGGVLGHRKLHPEQELQRSALAAGDDPENAAFKCPVCGKLLAKRDSLTAHMRSHTGEKPFTCTECGKRLSNKGSLTYHMRSFHSHERPHTCQFCGAGFLSKDSRLVHERIHTGEKPFECLTCGMAFRCTSNLAQHARVHSDARPHVCSACGKSFGRKGALAVHMRTHTGEKPYPCDVCGRGFTQKNDMLKHRRTHTPVRAARCQCGAAFKFKGELTRHRLEAHGPTEPLDTQQDASAQRDASAQDDPAAQQVPAEALEEDEEQLAPAHTVLIATADGLLTAFPEISVPDLEHTQTVILQRF